MERGMRAQQGDAQTVWQALVAHKVMAIVRLTQPAPLVDVASALMEGGIRVIEFPLTTPGALDAITRCRSRFGDALVVGTGTAFDATDARRAADAGAQFLASFGCTAEVVAAAHAGGAFALPNALTPTEIVEAWRAGADAVKVFPVHAFGPGYLTHLRGPLPHIPLVPSGGIPSRDVPAYLRAGATAVGVGDLLDFDILASADWATLTARARSLVDAVQAET